MNIFNNILEKTKGDRWIWLIIFALSFISILAVYSSTGALAYKSGQAVEKLFFAKHLVFVLVGIALIYLTHLMNYKYFAGISKILMIITIPLLLYTLIFGVNLNDASRWVRIPIIGITFQTSDVAKLALITYLARTLSKKQQIIKDLKESFIPLMGAVGVVVTLIAIANLSTAVMLFGTSCLLLVIGRVSLKQIMAVSLVGVVLLGCVFFLGPRRKTYLSRIETFMHPDQQDKDKRLQSEQSKVAIAKGYIFGRGPGNSTQRNFLPHPYSDFIFAIIIEEYGFLGGLVMISLYLALLYRCVRIVVLSDKAFGALMAAGLGFSLTIQAFANMAVSVGLGPVTGVPMPLVSMGGTSMIFTSIAFGIILSVSNDVEEKKLRQSTDPEKIKNKKVVVGNISTI